MYRWTRLHSTTLDSVGTGRVHARRCRSCRGPGKKRRSGGRAVVRRPRPRRRIAPAPTPWGMEKTFAVLGVTDASQRPGTEIPDLGTEPRRRVAHEHRARDCVRSDGGGPGSSTRPPVVCTFEHELCAVECFIGLNATDQVHLDFSASRPRADGNGSSGLFRVRLWQLGSRHESVEGSAASRGAASGAAKSVSASPFSCRTAVVGSARPSIERDGSSPRSWSRARCWCRAWLSC